MNQQNDVCINHIVLDIGQVLLHWDPEVPFKRLIPDQIQRQWFLTEVCNAAWNREQDRGRDWTIAEDLLIERFPEQTELIRAYRRDWMQMLTHVIEDSVELMKQLINAGRDLTLLTNWNQHTFAASRKKYDFLNQTRGVTVSGEVGLVKPDPQIYRLHEETFDLTAENTLFFDDSQSNVEAARSCGWIAELFVSPEQMQADLKRYQLL